MIGGEGSTRDVDRGGPTVDREISGAVDRGQRATRSTVDRSPGDVQLAQRRSIARPGGGYADATGLYIQYVAGMRAFDLQRLKSAIAAGAARVDDGSGKLDRSEIDLQSGASVAGRSTLARRADAP